MLRLVFWTGWVGAGVGNGVSSSCAGLSAGGEGERGERLALRMRRERVSTCNNDE